MPQTTLSKKTPRNFGNVLEHPFQSINEELEHLFGRLSQGWSTDGNGFASNSSPSIDIAETDNTLQVTADLPGLKPEEVEIEVTGGRLRISGRQSESKEDEGKRYHRLERRHRSFFRMVDLPCEVEQEAVAAELRDGVLQVTLPKCEQAKAHKIPVKG